MNNLVDEVEKLKAELASLRKEIEISTRGNIDQLPNVSQDELMDIKEVQSTLGICYNSLNKLVRKGLLKPIRINQRRVRFTRGSIIQYINSLK